MKEVGGGLLSDAEVKRVGTTPNQNGLSRSPVHTTVCRSKRSEQTTTDCARCWPKVFSGCCGSGRKESMLPLPTWGDHWGVWSSQIHPAINPGARTLQVNWQTQCKQVMVQSFVGQITQVQEVHGVGFQHRKPLTLVWRVYRSNQKHGLKGVLWVLVTQGPLGFVLSRTYTDSVRLHKGKPC